MQPKFTVFRILEPKIKKSPKIFLEGGNGDFVGPLGKWLMAGYASLVLQHLPVGLSELPRVLF